MVREDEANCAANRSVSPEFIIGAAERARAAQGEDVNPKVIPFKGGTLTPEQLMAWSYVNSRVKPK